MRHVFALAALLTLCGCASPSPEPSHHAKAWDQFTDESGALVWRCRDIETGQFVPDADCDGQPLTDERWDAPSR